MIPLGTAISSKNQCKQLSPHTCMPPCTTEVLVSSAQPHTVYVSDGERGHVGQQQPPEADGCLSVPNKCTWLLHATLLSS